MRAVDMMATVAAAPVGSLMCIYACAQHVRGKLSQQIELAV